MRFLIPAVLVLTVLATVVGVGALMHLGHAYIYAGHGLHPYAAGAGVLALCAYMLGAFYAADKLA